MLSLTSQQADEVPDLGEDEPLHRNAAGVGASGKEKDELSADHACLGAACHRGAPHLLEAERAKELAEAREALDEAGRDRLDGDVASRDARAAREHDSVNGARQRFPKGAADLVGLVAHERAQADRVAGLLREVGEEPARLVAEEVARVADRDDRERDRLGRVVLVLALGVRQAPAPFVLRRTRTASIAVSG